MDVSRRSFTRFLAYVTAILTPTGMIAAMGAAAEKTKMAALTAGDASDAPVQQWPWDLPGHGFTRDVQVQLGDPDIRVRILFAAGRVVLVGSSAPNFKGYISSGPGHDPGWLYAATNPAYLAEKFLEKKWTHARAVSDVRAMRDDTVRELEEDGDDRPEHMRYEVKILDDLLHDLEFHYLDDEHRAIGAIIDELDCSDGVPGEGYDEAEMSWVSRVQAAFRATMSDHV